MPCPHIGHLSAKLQLCVETDPKPMHISHLDDQGSSISLCIQHAYVTITYGTSIDVCNIPLPQKETTPVGFEPTREDPIGLAGRRLNRSAKVSLVHV